MHHLSSGLKEAMRKVPSAVALVTGRDESGQPHGMAASAVISVSMDPPSMLVAVNRTAGLYPVVEATRRLCINFLAQHHEHLLEPFSRSDMRGQRFVSPEWADVEPSAPGRLPWLPNACAVVCGEVDKAVPYGTHTLFIVRVLDVLRPQELPMECQPMVWLEGRSAPLAPVAA